MLIATGTFIFLICFLGCYGAIKNSWIMLMAFSVLLGIIFIFEFSAGIAGYVLRDKTSNYLEDSLTTAMYKYNNSTSTATMWDLVQTTFTCCGVKSYEDWTSVMNGTDLPISCCPTKPGTSGSFYCNAVSPTSSSTNTPMDPSTAHQRKRREAQPTTTFPYNIGCETAFGKWVKAHAVDIGAVCFTLAVLQLIGIGFSCHLSKQLKNSYYST
ncbi:unnamed protein product [Diabrotica balteata]|nr:unnamed protein product [Diabrotica balteata]